VTGTVTVTVVVVGEEAAHLSTGACVSLSGATKVTYPSMMKRPTHTPNSKGLAFSVSAHSSTAVRHAAIYRHVLWF